MPDDANTTNQARKRPGRKQKIGTAISDFVLEEIRAQSEVLASKYRVEGAALRRAARARGEILGKHRPSPLKRALDDILNDPNYKGYCAGIDARTLQNQLSLTKKGRSWEAPDCPVEHDELERICPPQRSNPNFRVCNNPPDDAQPDDQPKEDAQ